MATCVDFMNNYGGAVLLIAVIFIGPLLLIWAERKWPHD